MGGRLSRFFLPLSHTPTSVFDLFVVDQKVGGRLSVNEGDFLGTRHRLFYHLNLVDARQWKKNELLDVFKEYKEQKLKLMCTFVVQKYHMENNSGINE